MEKNERRTKTTDMKYGGWNSQEVLVDVCLVESSLPRLVNRLQTSDKPWSEAADLIDRKEVFANDGQKPCRTIMVSVSTGQCDNINGEGNNSE